MQFEENDKKECEVNENLPSSYVKNFIDFNALNNDLIKNKKIKKIN